MQTLTYQVAISVDGFVAADGGAVDAFPTTGDHVTEYIESLRGYGTVLMGRKTYDMGRAFGVLDPYPHLKTYVFSRTMEASPHPAITVVADDAAGVVRRLKAEDGPGIYLCGAGELAATLFEARLIDELILKVNPLVLGTGVPLVARLPSAVRLELRSTKVHGNGVIVTRYRVAA